RQCWNCTCLFACGDRFKVCTHAPTSELLLDDFPKPFNVHPGEVLKLSCPLPVTGTITWTKDGGSLGTNNRTLIEQEVLQIRDAMPKDSGLYACTSVGKDTVCFIVNVTDATWSGDDEDDTDRSEDTWADSAPYWTSPEKMKYNFHLVPAATTVKFRCAAGGYPQPTLRWLKNGRPFRQEDRMGGYKVGETLIHQTANTNIISASLFPLFAFHSVILLKDLLPGFLSNTTVRIGEDAQFQCNVYVYGESHFQWLRLVPRNGSRYGPDGPPYIKVLKSSNIPTDMEFLTITNVTEEDAGEYLCKVSNHQGEAVQSAWLKVIPGKLLRK
uniref:receptor protein-tyrosine kinase n=1 Tax=Poecilia reticulata TaxID=8081 RepID=A0A3P9NWK8_POERE